MEGNPSLTYIIRSTWNITTVPTIHRAGSVAGLPKTWLCILQGSTWRLKTDPICLPFCFSARYPGDFSDLYTIEGCHFQSLLYITYILSIAKRPRVLRHWALEMWSKQLSLIPLHSPLVDMDIDLPSLKLQSYFRPWKFFRDWNFYLRLEGQKRLLFFKGFCCSFQGG